MRNSARFILVGAAIMTPVSHLRAQEHQEGPMPPGAQWAVHSWSRPRPPVVDPGPDHPPTPPPADATVLFNGRDLSQRPAADRSPAKALARGRILKAVPGTGPV